MAILSKVLPPPTHLPHNQNCPWEAAHSRAEKARVFPQIYHAACGLGKLLRHL
jgi:hypothetical protein